MSLNKFKIEYRNFLLFRKLLLESEYSLKKVDCTSNQMFISYYEIVNNDLKANNKLKWIMRD